VTDILYLPSEIVVLQRMIMTVIKKNRCISKNNMPGKTIPLM